MMTLINSFLNPEEHIKMTIIRQDPAEIQYYHFLDIEHHLVGSPNYYELVISTARNLFQLCHKNDLIDELNEYIKVKIEDKLGKKLMMILYVHRNMPTIQSETRHPLNPEISFYKPQITQLLEDMKEFIKTKINEECIPLIIFQRPPKQLLS